VKDNPGINQKALAEALVVAPPNLAPLLDRLEARGLLTRQRNPEDKRAQLVELTAQGTRLYGRALKAAAQADDAAVDKLSAVEREQLKMLLRKIFAD
jgi:DNA-binding MarR family transcriptional regulator